MKQLEIRIPVHSIIDLITNSSTEIFVHSENSLKPAKDLLNELLKMEGSDKKCDEIFDISIEKSSEQLRDYFQYSCEYENEELYEELGLAQEKNYNKRLKIIDKIVKDILDGKREIPDLCDNNAVPTYLIIKCKDEKYQKFVELLVKFLYSPDYYEYSNN